MTTSERIARRRLSLLVLGEYLENVSEACRVMGVSPQHFYELRKSYEEGGLEALVSLAVIVSFIGLTRSEAGLRVHSEVDRGTFWGGITITDEQIAQIKLRRHRFHGDWNYTIHPST